MTIKVITNGGNGGGLAKGEIEAAGFPTEIQIDSYKDWNATSHNIGDTGIFGLGIVNSAGNPGNLVLKVDGKETVISPNQYMRYYYIDAKPNCTRLTISGEIKFSLLGSYTVKVWAMHLDAGTWYYDDEEIITITIVEESTEPTFWEKLTDFAEKNPIPVAIGVGVVIGGVVVWQKKQEK